MPESAEILIVGGGLVGTSLALALDAAGRDVALVEAAPSAGHSGKSQSRVIPAQDGPVIPAQAGIHFDLRNGNLDPGLRRDDEQNRGRSNFPADDNDRNLVLARASVNALRALDVWPRLDALAGTIRRVEVSRAGEFGRLRLSAADAGVDALGRVVPGRVLAAALQARLSECTHVRRLAPATLVSLTSAATGWRARVRVDGAERTLDARLVVGADGSHSLVRTQVGIAAHKHDYAQSLFVCTVACGREVPDCAFERFTDAGPVALLPLPNGRRGLVLTVAAAQHDAVAAMDDAAFVDLAQQRFGWKLGALTRPGKRFPHRIQRVLAAALTAPRAVLVGNAAQTVHPIGAQGFNLGLRDALTLAELLDGAADPGAIALLDAYAQRRQPDRDGVLAFSHGLIALGCLAQPMLAPLRSLALLAFDRVPPLRHGIARRGMGFRGLPPAAALDAGP